MFVYCRYPPTQFGFWFACLSTASNLIGTVGPGIATALAVTYGWRSALQIPAALALLASAVIPFCCWDKPSDVGYEDQLTLGGKNCSLDAYHCYRFVEQTKPTALT